MSRPCRSPKAQDKCERSVAISIRNQKSAIRNPQWKVPARHADFKLHTSNFTLEICPLPSGAWFSTIDSRLDAPPPPREEREATGEAV